ncbi:hypothetical protein ANCDUO_26672 [Ancylostoma duodenale]|uniref:Uncharacterized protein n=1 Tax=Ancylostoma duodenale TaxID=51022 RepID=A0A0C2F466_9BILA|nr:hypothetical protein ANCDUO_26672 [Ancylostoma duodenale]
MCQEVKDHLIIEQAKVKRLERRKRLRRHFAAGRHRKILFSDEKWFDGERAHNHQNDRVWLKGKPPLAGITYIGKAPLIFVHEEVKVQGPQYFAILENKVLTWAPW